MSMTRQLWLSILGSVLIALVASVLAALLNARAYLETQLAMKNQDNATTLAVALSQGGGGPENVAPAVTALFDSGHYALIQVVDTRGVALVDKVGPAVDSGAPDWFVRLLPLRSLPGRAEISSGWQPVGTLTLISDAGFAHRALWDTAVDLSVFILAAGLLAGLLCSLILHRITRPLQAVLEQAEAINQRRFITMPEPKVPEMKALAAAMNDTVNRLRIDFEEDARRYERMRLQANFDTLTGLANRVHFLASLDSALDQEDTPFGALAIVRLRKLGKINRALGREVANDLLRRIGARLDEMTGRCVGAMPGHLNGADFALLLPAGCDPAAALNELLLDLQAVLDGLAGDYSTVYISHAAFQPGEAADRLLARLDQALARADVAGGSAVLEAASESGAAPRVGAEAWRATLRQALDSEDHLRLDDYPLRLGDGHDRHREAPLRLRSDASGEWLAAGRFVPISDRLGLVRELDLNTLKLAIAELEADEELSGLWINLSAKAVGDAEFRARLLELLGNHPACRDRLWLEIPEAGGLARLEALRELSRDLKPLGCRIGLEHYGHQFNQIGRLYDLGLDFLKVDASFIHGLDGNPGNQAFLAGLLEIAHRIGMLVFAEGVERDEELAKLLELGFDGASGAAVR